MKKTNEKERLSSPAAGAVAQSNQNSASAPPPSGAAPCSAFAERSEQDSGAHVVSMTIEGTKKRSKSNGRLSIRVKDGKGTLSMTL